MSNSGLLSPYLTPAPSDGVGKLRSTPVNNQSTYTLLASDNGRLVSVTGNLTIPANAIPVGSSIAVFNNSAAAITVTIATGVTAYVSGINAIRTSASLATRGICSISFYAQNSMVMSGDLI
jgi:hypothetical protein